MVDMSKAFDSINHALLQKKKLDGYGVRGCELQWFENYLNERRQRVNIRTAKSGLRGGTTRIYTRSATLYDFCEWLATVFATV